MSKEIEEWKPVVGYEGFYEVSDWGNVRSVDRDIKTSRGIWHYKGKTLKPQNNGNNHWFVNITCGGNILQMQVHRLVAEAFIPNPNNYEIVHHIDHNPQNNAVENLMWMSDENHRGMHTRENKSIEVYQYTLEGKLVAIWSSANEVARKLGFSSGNILSCCCGTRKTHKGFRWKHNEREG